MKTPKDVMKMIKDKDLKMVDVKFTDLFGQWQHFSMPVEDFDAETAFEEGMGFDGSSIRGFQSIEASDMILLADPSTAIVDPILEMPTLSLICDIYDPITREPYSRDPRYVAKKAVKYLESLGIADTAYFGPEAEFFVFDQIMYSAGEYSAAYQIDSIEGPWNNEIFGFGHSVPHKRGYFPVPPLDSLQDLRSTMVRTLIDAGVDVELHHHEVGTAGQCEIDMKYGPLVEMADMTQIYKYVVKNVGKAHGKTVTFMPKPIFADNGSGMHTHQSLWKDGEPLFAGDEYAGLSQMALWYIGGILKHINALLGHCGAHHQLLSPPGSRLRSPGRDRLLRSQPLRRLPHSHVLAVTQSQAHRIPLPRSHRQSLPGFRRHAHGWSRRHQEPDRSRRASRDRSV